ncbi:kinase non-catalytic C-lobe domain-containing protein 1 [Trichosurus vulpecula]|uniref:kinase non-catalytic C-lobe domain-containing protein 1 n=1 Tax=Trichosurus vulpecula TaxID=9337 RepID=UPI00186ACD8C|nr:kinase non-catalytic C-lobe domain-containing protein 1 [Trichosurus vulpecula]
MDAELVEPLQQQLYGGQEEEEEEEEELDFYDFEPLPALLEDEENVSLADILSLRDSCLTEQDIWAVCLECSRSLRSISHSAIFQTLCITPDTLAFNTNGNVCFMEQLSDDPEGAFVPPEFDITGNTFEAHIYSLGATLKAAIEYVIEPELEPKFCKDLEALLDQMQEESPGSRPNIESIIALCEGKVQAASSCEICRDLSAVGRRVLSIESFGTFQDVNENMWRGRMGPKSMGPTTQPDEKRPDSDTSTVPDSRVGDSNSTAHRNLTQRPPTGERDDQESFSKEKLANFFLDSGYFHSDLDRGLLKKSRLRKIQTFPRLLMEVPESSNFCMSFPSGGSLARKNQLPASELLPPDYRKIFPEGKTCPFPIKTQPKHRLRPERLIDPQGEKLLPPAQEQATNTQGSGKGSSGSSGCDGENSTRLQARPGEETPDMTERANDAETSGALNKSALLSLNKLSLRKNPGEEGCLPSPTSPQEPSENVAMVGSHEEHGQGGRKLDTVSNEQWVSLQELLSRLGRPFGEYELWALCRESLFTLQSYIEYPAYLCLDSVLVDSEGNVLFGALKDAGSYNPFYVAPEVERDKVVTEKASVYCVAAILWTAAKFNLAPKQKLTLPRKLKGLLLDMARSSAVDRPSVAQAMKVCSSYLHQRGMDSKKILAHLSTSPLQVYQEEETIGLQSALSGAALGAKSGLEDIEEAGPGFVPFTGDGKLVAVEGSVPHPLSTCRESPVLPAAFTSSATHFKPIVLAQEADVTEEGSTFPSDQGDQLEGPCPAPGSTDSAENKMAEEQMATVSPKTPETPTLPRTPPGSPEALPPGSSAQVQPLARPTSSGSQHESDPSTPGDPSEASGPPTTPLKNGFLPTQAIEAKPVLQEELQGPDLPCDRDHRDHAPCDCLHSSDPVGKESSTPGAPGLEPKEPSSHRDSASAAPSQPLQKSVPRSRGGEKEPSSTGPPPDSAKSGDRRPPSSHSETSSGQKKTIGPSLQRVMHLIQEEFAFDGYLENGLEALIMGEYIYALKDLTYATFCGAISEKFCDLYWNEKLLQNLFKVVNGKMSPPGSILEMDDSEWGSQGYGRQKPVSGPAGGRQTKFEAGKLRPRASRTPGAPPSPASLSEMDANELSQSNFEVGFRPQKMTSNENQEHSTEGSCLQDSPGGEGTTYGVKNITPSPCPAELRSCSPGWCSAFYEADCFGPDVYTYVKKLGRQKDNNSQNVDAPSLELEQQLMMEKRNYRKTLKFRQKLLQKEKRSRGSEVKTMLSKLKGQLEETKAKVQFLELVKKYLQVAYAEQWGLQPWALPVIVNISAAGCDTLDFSPLDESSSLIFYNVNKHQGNNKQRRSRILQAGTPLGLMAYLYSSDAFLEGYVQQFLYTFRYFCTPEDFLQFLLDRINSTLSRANQDPTSTFTKIYNRSFCILQAWIEDCYTVDFTRNASLLGKLEEFISSKVAPLDGYGEHLRSFLEVATDGKCEGPSRLGDLEDDKEADEDTRSLNALCRKLSEENLSRKGFNWKLPRGNGFILPHHKERPYTIASALPKPCFLEEFCGAYGKTSEKGPYFLTEYSTHQLFSQLTLMQQEMFQKCHPVHFLNSRALGVLDKSTAMPKCASSESLSAKVGSLFLPSYTQDKYLLQLLRNADNVSTWVAAEIVTSHTSKLQVNLLSKFLLVAKASYEQRNFSTAMQILGGLEHLLVRQLPAWKILPAKIAEIMEELKAVEVFLKSDSVCLMEGRRFRTQPTIPSAHLLAMHIQQLETGGFTMTNGAHKWSKLRNIAKVVSQVHAFQENPYPFAADHKLQSYLKQRIARFSGADISLLAADNRANFHQVPGEKHSRKIQDTLRRMKATFQ